MSSDPAIRAEGLSKRYRIGAREESYKTLRESLSRIVSRPFAGLRRNRETAELWALEGVSFDVSRGEVLGIVGRNGAGKSTLLKVLTRITEPTRGRAELRGRVGSLLEVGTGFHPELTGRENTYLNGAILGMRRAEITAKLDEIIAFAEVEKFIDTPVKHYSSGMYLRLAFAVAAHLETEILLVDEVLAVGDARFQRRCLAKMGEVGSSGRTVLFVSHNLQAVQNLCERCLWLEGGRLAADGPTSEVVALYLSTSLEDRRDRSWPDQTGPGNDKVRLEAARVEAADAAGTAGRPLSMRTPLRLSFEYSNLVEGSMLNLSLHVYDQLGTLAFNTAPVAEPLWFGKPLPRGRFTSAVEIPGDLLNAGVHRVEVLFVHEARHVVLRVPDVVVFEVVDNGELHGGWHGRWPGVVHPHLPWKTHLQERALP